MLGVNVIGNVTGEYGLGEAARSNLRAFEAANIPFVISNFDVPWHRNLDSSYTEFSDSNPYPINLVNFNPDPDRYRDLSREYFKDRYNIGFWAWELSKFTHHWNFAFEFFDEIWTPSNHAADAIASASPIPVFKVPHSLALPQPSLGREALGLPQKKLLFLFMFDFHSTLSRKNPFGLLEAYQKAFGESNKDVVLVLKFSNSEHFLEKREHFLAQVERCQAQVHLIEGHLTKEELNALIYNCDCYVSLHRAEGFGLTMAEAMYYGKPVIGTGYSSNIEFMNVSNSFLVRYDLVTIQESDGSYPQGSIWADPDIDHAAFLMQYIYHNYPDAQQVGRRAAQDLRTALSPQLLGERVKNRLEYIMKIIGESSWNNRMEQLQKNFGKIRHQSSEYVPTFSLKMLQCRDTFLLEEKSWANPKEKAWKKTARRLQQELNQSKIRLSREKDIEYCYYLLLGRQPMIAEKNSWAEKLIDKQLSTKEIVRYFLQTSEFQEKYRNGKKYPEIEENQAETYINYVYNLLLDREADEGGKRGWVNRVLTEKLSPKDVIIEIFNCDEFKNRRSDLIDLL